MPTRGLFSHIKKGAQKVLFSSVVIAGGLAVGGIVLGTALPSIDVDMSALAAATEDIKSFSLASAGGDVNEAPPQVVLGTVIKAPELPIQVASLPTQQEFSARSIIVRDHDTGQLLYQKQAYDPHVLASVTKLMTALVFLESDVDWDADVTVVADNLSDSHMVGGDVFSVNDLWFAGLAGSSNKAMQSLADSTGWPREAFVARMNEKASELGMSDSVFVEPTGLSSGNVSTAADVALLLSEAMSHEMIQRALLEPKYTLHSKKRRAHTVSNTNWLLHEWTPHDFFVLRGGKTGYIAASRYNFTMQVEDEQNNILDVVVLGAAHQEARFTEARDIATAVYDTYVWPNDPTYSEAIPYVEPAPQTTSH